MMASVPGRPLSIRAASVRRRPRRLQHRPPATGAAAEGRGLGGRYSSGGRAVQHVGDDGQVEADGVQPDVAARVERHRQAGGEEDQHHLETGGGRPRVTAKHWQMSASPV